MNNESPNPDFHREMRRQFARLWSESEKSVQAYVFSMVPSFHDAEDVIQQVAEAAAIHFDEYDPQRPFVAWVIGKAKYRILDHFRKAGRDRHVFVDALADVLAEPRIASSSQANDRAEALEHCLKELPERSRQLLDLRYVDGMNPMQIASQVDLTIGSVRVSLHRIRNLLAECISRRLRTEPREGA
jgi:RNA polymerase sigma-70 factor (ECF subfamily)